MAPDRQAQKMAIKNEQLVNVEVRQPKASSIKISTQRN